MLSKQAQNALIRWDPHGPKIIETSFKTKKEGIAMNIIQYYAPTNDYNEDANDQFYNRLQSIVEKCPTKNLTILMGNFNAKVGTDNTGYEDIMGRHGLGERKENGERFANLCAFNKLVIGGTIFPHKRIHKTTWTSSDHSTQNQIDHICINKKMKLDDLDFTDDLAPLSQTQQQMQEKTTSVAAASAAIGLNIHKWNSKILQYNTACTNPIKIDGDDLEDVKTFTYLGSIIDEHSGSDADVRARIGKARAAYLQLRNPGTQSNCQPTPSIIDEHGGSDVDVRERISKTRAPYLQLKNIWNSKQLSTNTKVRIFNLNVKTVLLHYQLQSTMGENKPDSSRFKYQEEALEVDRTHIEESTQLHHKASSHMKFSRPKEKRKTKERISPRNGDRHEKNEQKLDKTGKEGPGQSGLENAGRQPMFYWG
ncbi:unnamed protein product [Schistosoma curassoni]|uniref:DUF6451 domain-containing protein n=1 Tax=Schistosoma curassoni TaxID=6186 RepID=A0A183L1D0_9TREM|nr:unnamed protein product [Schistosoma curassoni]